MRTSILLATVASAALLTVAPLARADSTLCVHQSGACPAGAVDEGPDLQTALSNAGSDGQPTTIDVLAGTYTGPFLSFSNEPLVIAGAGSASTVLSGGSTVLQLGCASSCDPGTFAVHDLGLRLTAAGSTGLSLFGAFDAHNLAVTATTSSGALAGVALTGSATLEHTTVALPQTGAPTTGLRAAGVDTVSDVNLVADIGVSVSSSAGLTLSRATIGADVDGIDSHGPGTAVDSSLIRLTGDAAQGATSVASGVTSTLTLLNSTILASGNGDIGVYLQSEGLTTGNHQAIATVTNTIMWGLAVTDYCVRGPGGPAGALTLRYDDIDPIGSPVNCTATIVHPLAVTPGFVATGDPHLRFDSPLIDQGDPAVITAVGATDLGAGARLVDGDAAGGAARDIGAYEYQRRPPVAELSAPAGAGIGQVLSFDASGSFDPDPGETLSYHWDFGDGASAATAIASHAFATTGAHVATASMTDPTGQTTTAHVTVTIPAPGGGGGGTGGGGTVTTPTPPIPKPGGSGGAATTTPAGGTAAIHHTAPKLTLSVATPTVARLIHGLKVTATLTGSGHVTLRLRQGKRTLATRRLTFTRAGRRVAHVRLSARLARTLRHPTLTARLAGSTATVVTKRLIVRR